MAFQMMDVNIEDIYMPLGICVFILLIIWDIGIGCKKGVFWFPADALVLNGMTISFLQHLEGQNANHKMSGKQLLVDCSRITQSVFVGFLVPSMASAAHGGRWGNIFALFVSLSIHIAIELYDIYNSQNPTGNGSGRWSFASGGVLFLSNLSLLVILSIATMSGQYMRDNLSSRISRVLGSDDNENENYSLEKIVSWDTFKDKILPRVVSDNLSSRISRVHGSDDNVENGNYSLEKIVSWETFKDKILQRETFKDKILQRETFKDKILPWETFKDKILQSWITAHLFQPEHVMVRSAFSAGTGGIVTFCVIFFLIKMNFLMAPHLRLEVNGC